MKEAVFPFVKFPGTDTLVYIAATAFILNILVTVVLTLILRALKVSAGVDQTSPGDYVADVDDAGVDEQIDPHRPAHA